MAWIQNFFVCLFIMSTSAYKCKNCFIFPPQYQIYDEQLSYQERFESSRQMVARSAEHEQLRTNERSLPIHSETQRIQDEERRRHSSKIEDSRPRIENGSYKILNNPPETYITNRRSQAVSSADKVVFPGPTSEQSFIPEIPEDCKRIGICDSIPNYPKEHVDNILSQLGEGARNFQRDELDVSDTPDIAQRLGPQEDNMELCSFRERIVYPQAAPDKEGRWYMVVNSDKDPVQGFKVEICDTNHSRCADFASFQPGYEARCVQKFVRRTMLALDANGKTTDMMLKVPSCCSCVAKVML